MKKEALGPVLSDCAALGVVGCLLVIHAASWGTWLIDDAAISVAYGHNLIAGLGFVAQEGAPPVEGFSNPLWTFLLGLQFVSGSHEIVWPTKLISYASGLAALAALLWLSNRLVPNRSTARIVFLFAGLLLCLNPAFVIWTTSGLENGLYALLLVSLASLCVRETPHTAWSAFGAGTLAGAIALTRPEGIAYSWIFPASLLLGMHDRRAVGRGIIALAGYAGGVSIVVVPYEVFRVVYFDDWLPNTFYAKPGTSIARGFEVASAASMESVLKLLEACLGDAGKGAIAVLIAYPLALLVKSARQVLLRLCVPYFFLATAISLYLMLPRDWMPEFRFATPVLAFIYVFLLSFSVGCGRILGHAQGRVAIGLVVVPTALIVSYVAGDFVERSNTFRRDPTTPYEVIVNTVALPFNRYAGLLHLENATLLSPDLGGVLVHSRLRVVDLAGLCDKQIAHLIHRDPEALRDHILLNVRPTFVNIHSVWSASTRLESDPRFVADYIAIRGGQYVRRDALGETSGPEEIARLMNVEQGHASDVEAAFPRINGT